MSLRSEEYDDIYYSRENGAAESSFVYLGGNDLPARFANVRRFTVAELGFGTGLNLILTARAFLEHAPPEAMLLYFSVEAHLLPFHKMDLALQSFPELRDERLALLRLLRDSSCRVPGFHTLFLHRRIRLTLLHGDVESMLGQLQPATLSPARPPCGSFAGVDAWFPDGFAPARNPAMWSEGVFAHMARLSRPGATLATFTSAGAVRRGLEAAGFRIEKVPGYGSKREMIRGVFAPGSAGRSDGCVRDQHSDAAVPPFEEAAPSLGSDRARRAAVVGAGLAGITTAFSLLARGWHVDLYERNEGPGREGSGNPAGLFMPYVTAQPTPVSRLTLRACETLVSAVRSAGLGDLIHRTGIVRLTDHEEANRIVKGIASHRLPRSWIRRLPGGGFFLRKAGWAEPHAVSSRLVSVLESLYPHRFRVHWQRSVRSPSDVPNSHVVIFAAGTGVAELDETSWIPVKSVRGQLFVAPVPQERLPRRRRPAVSELYLIAYHEGLLVGATFEPFLRDAQRLRSSDERLLSQLEEQFPDMHRLVSETLDAQNEAHPIAEEADSEKLTGLETSQRMLFEHGRVGFRAQVKDYVPVIGPLPDRSRSLERIQAFAEDRRQADPRDLPLRPGNFVHGGGGSRGVMSSSLASEILVAWIEGEILPVEGDLAFALLPHRLLLREARTLSGRKSARAGGPHA